MSQRETIEFGYSDKYGNKQVFKSVDVTGMTESDIRHIKNEVYKEMYAALSNGANQHDEEEDYDAPQCGCDSCMKTVPSLESEVRVLRRKLDDRQDLQYKLEGQVELLKELLKEAWANGN